MTNGSSSLSADAPSESHSDGERAVHIARGLLEIGAVSLQPEDPFTWSSGLVAPIYCDNRRTLAHPDLRRRLRDGFVEIMQQRDLLPATIAGTATAGIPHAAWLAEALDAPMAYVRSAAKAHGHGRRIEGHLEAGMRAVVVEDLVSTGGSALDAVSALRTADARVAAVLSIFTYDLHAAATAFRDADVSLYTLASFGTLVDVAYEDGQLTDATDQTLREWRADPSAWSAQHGGPRLDV